MSIASSEVEDLKTLGDSLLAENKVRAARCTASDGLRLTTTPTCCALLQHGNAIKVFSDALKLATDTEEKSAILLSRSKAFTRSLVARSNCRLLSATNGQD